MHNVALSLPESVDAGAVNEQNYRHVVQVRCGGMLVAVLASRALSSLALTRPDKKPRIYLCIFSQANDSVTIYTTATIPRVNGDRHPLS